MSPTTHGDICRQMAPAGSSALYPTEAALFSRLITHHAFRRSAAWNRPTHRELTGSSGCSAHGQVAPPKVLGRQKRSARCPALIRHWRRRRPGICTIGATPAASEEGTRPPAIKRLSVFAPGRMKSAKVTMTYAEGSTAPRHAQMTASFSHRIHVFAYSTLGQLVLQ